MPDTDSDDELGSIEDVQSDSDIYGVVSGHDDNIEIDPNGSPVTKPKLHEIDEPELALELLNRYDTHYWIVGQEHNGNFQVWVPTNTQDSITVQGRMEISNPTESVRVGHSLRTPWVDEMYILDHDMIESRIDTFTATNQSSFPHVRIPSGVNPLSTGNSTVPNRRPHEGFSMNGSWLHGTDPDHGGTWEIFVPVSDAEVTVMDRLFNVKWHENAILRRSRGSYDITSSQDGLHCRQLFVVDEHRVPHDATGTVQNDDAVRRYETNVDSLVGDNTQ